MDSILLPVLFSRTLRIRDLAAHPPMKGRFYLLSNSLSASCKSAVLSCLQTDANAAGETGSPRDIIRRAATFQDVPVRNQWATLIDSSEK